MSLAAKGEFSRNVEGTEVLRAAGVGAAVLEIDAGRSARYVAARRTARKRMIEYRTTQLVDKTLGDTGKRCGQAPDDLEQQFDAVPECVVAEDVVWILRVMNHVAHRTGQR